MMGINISRRIRLFVLAGPLLLAIPASSQPAGGRTFGLGVVLGEPLGIASRIWINSTTTLNLVIGWNSGAWNDSYWGFTDGQCYNDGFYRNNRSYCNAQRYGRWDRPYSVFHVNGDYLIHNFDLIKSTQKFAIYYGPGVNFNFWKREVTDERRMDLGVRGNIGFAWMHATSPFDIFFELAPVLILFPGMDIDMTGGLGAHYYF